MHSPSLTHPLGSSPSPLFIQPRTWPPLPFPDFVTPQFLQVCGPRAMCMPYNPELANTTEWKFTCSCMFGQRVDPPPGSNADGQWDPTLLCTERNAKGLFAQAVIFFNALLALGTFIYACNTMVRLRRKSRKSCCKTKLTGEIIGIILQTSAFFVLQLVGTAQDCMMNSGVDHHWLNAVGQPFFFVLPLFVTLNTIVIAITWQHVGKSAEYAPISHTLLHTSTL